MEEVGRTARNTGHLLLLRLSRRPSFDQAVYQVSAPRGRASPAGTAPHRTPQGTHTHTRAVILDINVCGAQLRLRMI